MKTLRNSVAFLLFVFSIFVLTTCDCIKGEGQIETEIRTVESFAGVDLNIRADVYISKGEKNEIKIEAYENILEVIKTEVFGNVLEIGDGVLCIRNHNTVKIYLTMTSLSELTIHGSGSITTNDKINGENLEISILGSGDIDVDVDVDRIESEIHGSGDITLQGKVKQHDIQINGSGDLKAYNLETDVCNIHISGSGDSRVFVNDKLKVKILGSGNVKYRGEPVVSTNIMGSGEVIKK